MRLDYDLVTREQLVALYGKGVRLPDDLPGKVLVWQHRSLAAAEAYASANRLWHGHLAWAELREGLGWVSVCDLRPAIKRASLT